MSPIASALAIAAIAGHVALFAWGFSQAKPAVRRTALPALAAIAMLIGGVSAIGAWHGLTHTDYGELE